ncbi:unnamed protein product [Lampetra planeri]
MESLLRAELGTDSARPLGAAAGGGCISAGQSYETGRGHVHFDRFVSSTPRSTTAPHCSSQQRTQLNNSLLEETGVVISALGGSGATAGSFCPKRDELMEFIRQCGSFDPAAVRRGPLQGPPGRLGDGDKDL